jgi:predicted regulator of Ras-like GTPase activity (Roadblock/LC7/MglB family)
MEEAKRMLDEMKSKFQVIAAGYITRDGMPKYLEVPEGTYPETFSIMCATVLGAAGTAATELGQKNPEYVIVETGDIKIFIVSGGMKGLLVAAIKTENKQEEIIGYMKEIIEKI